MCFAFQNIKIGRDHGAGFAIIIIHLIETSKKKQSLFCFLFLVSYEVLLGW